MLNYTLEDKHSTLSISLPAPLLINIDTKKNCWSIRSIYAIHDHCLPALRYSYTFNFFFFLNSQVMSQTDTSAVSKDPVPGMSHFSWISRCIYGIYIRLSFHCIIGLFANWAFTPGSPNCCYIPYYSGEFPQTCSLSVLLPDASVANISSQCMIN